MNELRAASGEHRIVAWRWRAALGSTEETVPYLYRQTRSTRGQHKAQLYIRLICVRGGKGRHRREKCEHSTIVLLPRDAPPLAFETNWGVYRYNKRGVAR